MLGDQIHYTSLALQGDTIDVNTGEFFSPDGVLVANDPAEQVVIHSTQRLHGTQRSELPSQWVHSAVIGYDFYHYSKDFWLPHGVADALSWTQIEYSYHRFVNSSQWVDYS